MPILNNGGEYFLDDIISDIADPKPPITLCSSKEKTAFLSFICLFISFSSSGFIVWTLITLAPIPLDSKFLCAFNASDVNEPQTKMQTSLPSTNFTVFPILKL